MNNLFGIGLSGLDFTGSKSVDVTITPSDWSSNTCTKSVSGMTPQLAVVCCPSVSSRQSWDLCRVRCISQNIDQLTFSCVTVPNVNITANIMMFNTLRDDLVSMSIQGDVTNPQFIYDPVDDTGLLYQITRYSGSVENVLPDSISPVNWEGTVGTQTLTAHYHEYDKYVSATKNITVLKKAVSLTVNGNWTNTQYCGTVPDPTGLTFTCSYNDGTSKSVSGTLVSPSTWGSTVGTQTATFSYTENGVTVSGTKNATVEAVIPISLSVSGDWSNAQHEGEAPNTAGLTFTATYIDGSSKSVTPIVNPTVWGTGSGNQTATFSYIEEGVTVSTTKSANMTYTYDTASDGHGTVSGSGTYTYDASNAQTKSISYSPATGYMFDEWTVSGGSSCSASGQVLTINAGCHGNITVSATFELIVLVSLSISGDWSNTQYTGQAVDYTGLTFTANYNNGTTATVNPSSYSPTTWSSTVGTQSCTFYYSENGTTVSASKSASVQAIVPTSLSITGDWSNTQYTEQSVDYTGLVFTASYSDGSSASVTPTSLNPSTWSSTAGTQSCTFSYTESGVTVSASKTANIINYWATIPLTLQARESGSISISKSSGSDTVYYSKNGGNQSTYSSSISVVTGDKVSFYRTLSSSSYNMSINCTNNCYIYGNIMSLYSKDNFANLTTIEYDNAFVYLFESNTHIDINESVGKLVLPATTLSSSCYRSMFSSCSSLTTAPALPATTLASECYGSMFWNCTSLTTAPVLSATTMAQSSCFEMFRNCTSLTTIPSNMLPATTLAQMCYNSMFWGCTGLTTIPSNMLPATTLDQICYSHMFHGCTGLTTAPTLPATTLAQYCYEFMFYGCTGLTSITCLATDISADYCTDNWVDGVASSGTFTTPSGTPWTTGASGIPSGWTRINA